MSGYLRAATVVALLGCPLAAWADGAWTGAKTTVAYDCPPGVAYVWIVPSIPCPVPAPPPPAVCPPAAPAPPSAPTQAPFTAPPATTYASPTAAPPSPEPSTPPPPLAAPAPTLPPGPSPQSQGSGSSDSRSYFDAYAVASRDPARATGDRCSVYFWNLTDHDLALKLGESQTRVLPHGKSLSLEVGRQFTWKVDGRDPQKEQIPLGESALEIVIRR